MKVTRKNLEIRVKRMRDVFGLPYIYLRFGDQATEADLRVCWPKNPIKKVQLCGVTQHTTANSRRHDLTEWFTLREMDAYLDGLTNGLHIARRFEGLRRPGSHIGNAWADFFFKIMGIEKGVMAENYGLEVAPAYPWQPESPLVPFGRNCPNL